MIIENRPFQQLDGVSRIFSEAHAQPVSLKKLPTPWFPQPFRLGAYRSEDGSLLGICMVEASGAALLANLPVEAEPYGLRYPLTRLEKGMYALQKLFEPAPGISVVLQLPVLRPGTPFSEDVEALLKKPRVRADYAIGIRDGVTGTLRFLAPKVEIQEGVLRLAA